MRFSENQAEVVGTVLAGTPPPAYNPDADFDHDGHIGFDDLAAALNYATALPAGAISSHASGGVRNAIGYSGYHFDPAAGPQGMYLARHRWYSPELGVWITRDPAGYADGMGLYEYVAGDPLYWTDPMGLSLWDWVKDAWDTTRDTIDEVPGVVRDWFTRPGRVIDDIEKGWDSLPPWVQWPAEFVVPLPALLDFRHYFNRGCYKAAFSCLAQAGVQFTPVGKLGKAASLANKAVKPVTKAAAPAKVITKPTRNRTVIGKLKDLENRKPGENTLLKHLPDQGSPKRNWKQNSRALRIEMQKSMPIRDASVDRAGNLIKNTGFLKAERNLLQQRGWTYNPHTRQWRPPAAK